MSYNKLIATVTMMLGGRVAEEMLIKDVSTGASNDIERATKIVRKMVTEWGMSANLGPINYGSSSEVFIGRDYQTQVMYSEKTAAQIDEEIKTIFDGCYNKAKEIISSHIKEMNTMIEVLLEKETIYFNEVELIMKGKTTKQILNVMAKEEIRNKAKIEIERAEADLERVKKEQIIRIKTAEALKNGGVITEEEIQKAKSDSEKVIKQAEEKVAELKAKFEKENPQKTKKKNEKKDSAIVKKLECSAKEVLTKGVEDDKNVETSNSKEKETIKENKTSEKKDS